MFGYLIDMDGVIYRGAELIPGADRFIDSLKRDQVPFLFLTNNSQRTQRDVATRLHAWASMWGRSTSSPAPWPPPASWRSRSQAARPL